MSCSKAHMFFLEVFEFSWGELTIDDPLLNENCRNCDDYITISICKSSISKKRWKTYVLQWLWLLKQDWMIQYDPVSLSNPIQEQGSQRMMCCKSRQTKYVNEELSKEICDTQILPQIQWLSIHHKVCMVSFSLEGQDRYPIQSKQPSNNE